MFGKRFWTIMSLYAVLVAASVPLALEWVPPNDWYGFRLPGARIHPGSWYELNALGGRLFIGAMLACAALTALIAWKGTEPMQRILPWITAGLIALSFWLVSLELVQSLPA